MRVSCTQCQAQYNVDDSRIPPQGVSITCPKCGTSFVVAPGGQDPAAVPLPSASPPGPRAVPLPGRTAPAAPAASAVPLPGRPATAPAQPAAPAQSAVPLPSSAPPAPPAPRAPDMADLFGGAAAGPAPQAARPSAGGGATGQYQVRRGSGRVFGPYDQATVVAMLRKQEFAGNEDISTDGRSWKPISTVPAFAEEIQSLMAAALGGLGALPSRSDPDLPGLPDADLPGLPNMDLPGLPNMDLPGLPNADLPGLANTDLPGLSNAALPGLSSQDLPGMPARSAPYVYTPDQHGPGGAAAGGDPLADIGLSFGGAGGGAVDAAGVDHAALAPGDPLAVDLTAPVEARQRQRGPRVKREKQPLELRQVLLFVASTLMIVILAAGVFTGLATDHGWFGYKWFGSLLMPGDDAKPVDTTAGDAPAVNLEAIDEYLARDTYQGFAQAVLVLSAQRNPPPKVAAKAAETYARMALLDDDDAALALGRAALSRVGDLALTTPALFASATLDLVEGKCDAAVETLRGEVGLEPPKEVKPEQAALVALMGLAHTCHKLADVDKATQYVDAVLVAAPRDTFAMWVQAQIALRAKDPDTAVGYLRKLVEEKPGDARAWLHLAEAALQLKGHEDEARDAFNQATEKGVGTLAAWQMGRAVLGLAKIHRERRQFKEAEEVATRSYEAASGHLPTLKRIGEFAMELFLYDFAQKVYRRAVELAPDDREAVVGLARALAGSRNQLEAYEAIRRLLQKNPKDAFLTTWMGHIQLAMTKRDEAKDLFTKARALDPKSADSLTALVRMELAVGDIDAAQRWLHKHRDEVAADQQAQIDLVQALVHKATRKFPAALASIQKALDGGLDTPAVQAQKGLILIDALEVRQAAPLIRDAYGDNPNDPFLVNAMAMLVIAQGKPREALKLLEEVVQRDKAVARYHLTMAHADIELGEFDAAIEAVRVGAEIEPRHIDVPYYRGLALRGKADYKNALAEFKAGETQSPKDPRFSLEVGRTYAMNGEFLDAIDYFKAAIIKDERWALAYYELGNAYMELVRYATAREQYDQALRLRPGWAEVHLKIGDAVTKTGDYGEALKQYKAAIEADPLLTEAYCKSGAVLKNNGKFKDAERDLEKCLKGNPGHPEAHKFMGYLLKERGKRKEAIEAFERHLKLNPGDLDAELVRDEIKYLRKR